MDNQQATQAELAWLAGIIEGEGWIGFSISDTAQGINVENRQGSTVKVEIKINNTDALIIHQSAIIFQKLGVNAYVRECKPSGKMKRTYFEVSTKHMKTVELILAATLPYMVGEKRERAELMRKFIELRRSAPIVENPAYANGARGRHGPRSLRPYTIREIEIIEACRALQVRGASETTRENRARAVQNLKRWNMNRQHE